MIDLSLINKNAIVCGSTQGIGKSIAMELAELGANVTLVARNEEALKLVLAELDLSKSQKHQYLVADFSDSLHVKYKANEYALQNNIDILVNNTGGPPAGAIV
ncbi:MAG: hypothetical protein RI934_905, partial [Bacteroidota bacterium]